MTRGRRIVVLFLLFLALPIARASGDRRPSQALSAAGECRLRLNEFLPKPLNVDWDRDGAVSPLDEWIELYNAGDAPCDLTGWQLDDTAGSGSPPYTIASGTLAAGACRLFYRRTTGITLDDQDWVRLVSPSGTIDAYQYFASFPDESYYRTADGLHWNRSTASCPPSPGLPNCSVQVSPTPSQSPNPTPQPSPTATRPPTASPTPSNTLPPTATGTPRPTETATLTPPSPIPPTVIAIDPPTATSTRSPRQLCLPLILVDVSTLSPTPAPPPTPTHTPTGEPMPTPSTCNYIGNSNTLRFHYPSCIWVPRISPDHRVCFATREEAIAQGYSPCQVCNP